MKKKESRPKKQAKPRVHKDLDGFELSIGQFGELKSNMKIERVIEFLDKNVDDKKLIERGHFDDVKKGKTKKKK